MASLETVHSYVEKFGASLQCCETPEQQVTSLANLIVASYFESLEDHQVNWPGLVVGHVPVEMRQRLLQFDVAGWRQIIRGISSQIKPAKRDIKVPDEPGDFLTALDTGDLQHSRLPYLFKSDN